MTKLFYLLMIMSFATGSFSQELNYSPKKKLFNTPIFGLLDFGFVPFDYDQDERYDFVGRDDFQNLVIYSEQGDGLEETEISSLDNYSRPYEVMDFNQDGFDDLVLAGFILLYDPAVDSYEFLSFVGPDEPTPTIIGAADFDGNGFNDLVTIYDGGSLQSNMMIHFWDGENFEVVALPLEYEPGATRLGDLEGDGDIDIAFINRHQELSPKILVNDGAGNFEGRDVFGFTALRLPILEFEDFDGDGDLDLLVSNYNNELRIYENTDNYLLPPFQTKVSSSFNGVSTRTADLNNDGKLEIISLEYNLGIDFKVNVYEQEEGLEYSLAKQLATFTSPPTFITLNPNYLRNALNVSDVENDGDLDIVVTYTLDDDPAVWLLENYEFGLTSNKNITTESLAIYPNPVADILNVNLPDSIQRDSDYIIYNSMGQKIQQGANTDAIDVTMLPEGKYFINIVQDNVQWVGKFDVVK